MEEPDSIYNVPLLAKSITDDDMEAGIKRIGNMEIDYPYAIHEDEQKTDPALFSIDKNIARCLGLLIFTYVNALLYIIYKYKN